ncbi:MAG: tetratricopeptide repeat-containing protein kinase family protein, partial [Planctomycetota bacterium]
MAPEQVRPGLEGRAPGVDVHAVGVMLFEQLSGGLPRDLTGLSIAAAIHRIAQDEPLSLAALAPSLPRDVAWVIDRAVASEPSRRYGSALALADELDRLVRREPVLARPPSRLYRVERFVRRNRLASLGLSVAAVSLVAGLAVSVVQSQEARAAAAEARSEARKAAAINEFILERMLGAFSPLDLGRDVKVADVLDLAAPEIDLAFCDQPDVAAAVSSTLGRSYFQLGLFDEARALLERAHRDLRRLKGPVHRETLQAADSLFGCLYQLEQREQARTLVRESLESIEGSTSASTPEAFQLAFAEARLVFSDGDRERGMALALAAYEGAAATYPNGEETLEISYGVAVMQSTAGETEAAMARVESYLAGLRRVHGPRNPREVLAMGELAFMYMRLGRSAESIEIGREAAKRAQADFGRLHPTTIFTVAGLSSLLGETNQLEDALGLSSECHKSSTELLGAKHRSTLRVRSNHAILLRKQGELDSAMAVAEECLADRLEALGPLDPEVATSYDVLAAIQMELRRYDDADDSLKRALDIAVSAFGDVAPEVADILYNRASLLSRKGEAKEAEKMFRELHRVELEIYGTEHPFPVLDLYQVGRMLVQQDRPEEALPILSSVLESQRRLLDPTSPDLFRTMAALGHCHLLCEHPEEAERLLAKALRAMNEQRLDELIELTRVKEYLEVARQAR